MSALGKVILDTEKNCWVLTVAPHVSIRLKRVFERIRKDSYGALTLTNTSENARELAWFLERYPLDISAQDRAVLSGGAADHKAREARVAEIVRPDYKAPDVELALPLREYQKVAVALTRANGALLVADEVGLGKSATGIGVLASPDALPALVVTLIHLPRQWEREIQRFAPALSTHILKSGKPYDLMKRRGKTVPFPDVVISNYHKLHGWGETLAPQIKSVIFDEIQELRKGQSSLKGAAAAHMVKHVRYRCGASATPIFNYGAEIFYVLQYLFPDALGTREEFLREWCTGNNYGAGHARLRDPVAFGTYLREQGMMLRRTRIEVGRELPDVSKVPCVIEADLDEFTKIESSAAELARVILTQGGLEKGAKLRAAEELSWRLRQATGVAKAAYVADFVRMLVENGEQVVLFGWHQAVYGIWKERLKDLAPVFYTGAESEKEKDAAKEAFVLGRSHVLVISLRAGAGLDGLQHVARTVVFGELDWSPGVMEQCLGRVYRDGQKDKVVAYYLICDHGSDPVVADVLGLKKSQSDGLLDPEAPLVEALSGEGANIKALAEAFLKQRGLDVPVAAVLPETAPVDNSIDKSTRGC